MSQAAKTRMKGNHGAPMNEITVDFIKLELDLADTCCKLAVDSHSPETKRLYQSNARRILTGALNAMTKLKLDAKDIEDLAPRIEGVKASSGLFNGHASQVKVILSASS